MISLKKLQLETTNFDKNRKKEVPKIQKFDKQNFLTDFEQIDWNNYLKYTKMIQTCHLSCFLEK